MCQLKSTYVEFFPLDLIIRYFLFFINSNIKFTTNKHS